MSDRHASRWLLKGFADRVRICTPLGVGGTVPDDFCRFTVIDSGFSRQDDQEVSYDPLAPRRNAATSTSLAVADEVLALWAGDPVGGCNDSSAG